MLERESLGSRERLSYQSRWSLAVDSTGLSARFEFFVSGGEDGGVASGWGDAAQAE